MVLALAAQGHRIYGVSRRTPPPEVQDRLAMHIAADLCEPEAAAHVVDRVIEAAGTIDVLINNAGAGIGGALEETDDRAMHALFEINYFAMTRLCRAVLPGMRARRAGRILNFSSLGGRVGLPFQGAYSATKFAVEGYTEALRSEVRPFGIWVSLIEPGDFATGFTASRIRTDTPDSPYAAAGRAALHRIESDERGGSRPELLARKVAKIVRARRPRMRYPVGNPAECALVRARHLLGDRVFLAIIAKYYGT